MNLRQHAVVHTHPFIPLIRPPNHNPSSRLALKSSQGPMFFSWQAPQPSAWDAVFMQTPSDALQRKRCAVFVSPKKHMVRIDHPPQQAAQGQQCQQCPVTSLSGLLNFRGDCSVAEEIAPEPGCQTPFWPIAMPVPASSVPT